MLFFCFKEGIQIIKISTRIIGKIEKVHSITTPNSFSFTIGVKIKSSGKT
jgi:hypothetical protein